MTVLEEIAAERKRQVEVEGWTTAHDDEHIGGELARAAAAYAFAGAHNVASTIYSRAFANGWSPWVVEVVKAVWPFSWNWWKPKGRRTNLIRAGALIVAEIERLDRAAAK